MEIWKEIEGFDGKYQISNKGNVKSLSKWKNGENLKPGINKSGYKYVNLVKDGRNKIVDMRIHRLVAKYFIPNPEKLPEVNHIDGNKLNNNVENLQWCSREYNIRHAFDNGLILKRFGNKNPNSKVVLQKDKNGNIIKEWQSVGEIHRIMNYSINSIVCCCNKKPKYHTAYGYIWEYKD